MSKIKIIMFDTMEYDKASFDAAADERFQIDYVEARLNPKTATLADGYDVVCAFVNDELGAGTIDVLVRGGVKLLAMRCAGYNNVDIKHAYKKLHIVRVPAYSPYAVAEHAMGMLLTSVRRIHKAYNRTRDFNFSLSGLTGFDLHGKTVGVIGTGKIGRVFADICAGFGMNVLGYDMFPAKDTHIEYVDLPELFKKSDVISLHCPLTEENMHMIDAQSISSMKTGVIIINTSRGALIDSTALLEGLKNRKIGAACLDVYEEESDVFFQDLSTHIMDDDVLARLLSMPNVLITSHQAFLTKEALSNIADSTLSNIAEFFETGMCKNEICYACEKLKDCPRNKTTKCF